ncbi:DUF1801 domain-containing protein [Parasphingorhabdus flavimaris]|jgi:hypothetical protein|uniref:DUF1801 domain-containing protein n=1 Tax=Parasphingorhabdus flavimaris TaxID=266812 RepID=A0ABX2N085_9SPHN|nr:DUF1801 domain-containing protein [Parasphingorhabdus flavimaris]|tara:strand:- start:9095 stop:9568 length:474 start_codon:yes stop_codon:yes gene_type:complete
MICSNNQESIVAKAELKTKANEADVDAFIATAQPERRQEEARQLVDLFRRITGEEPRMWGPSIIGFGSYDYKYDSGREGTMCRTGFSPRKAKLSLYLMGAYCTPEAQAEQERLFGLLGKHSVGKSCLYINRLEQVDMDILEQLIRNNWDLMNERYPQ